MSSLRTDFPTRTLHRCVGVETGEPSMESRMAQPVPRLSSAGFRRGSVSLETGMPDARQLAKKDLKLDENSNYVAMHSAPATPTGCEHDRCPMFVWRENQREVMQELFEHIGMVLLHLGNEIQSSRLLREMREAPSQSELLFNLIGRPAPLVSSQTMTVLRVGFIATLALRAYGGVF